MIRRATLLSALAAVALLGSRAEPGGAPRPFPPDTPTTKDAQARAVCSQCHRSPPPDILPRDAWKRTVAQMKGFVLEGVGAPVPGPPVEDFDLAPFVDYYESRAPAALPPPEPWPPTDDDAVRFVRHAIRGSGAGPLVANVALADLDRGGRPRIVASEMARGLVLVADPRAGEPRLASVAPVPHPCHAEAVDLDRDGRTDLLVADLGTTAASDDQTGSVVWLRREASGVFRAVTLARGLPRVADVQAADFDGDGDLDLVVAAFGWRWIGAVYLFENRTTDWDRPVFVRREIDSRKGAIHVPVADLNRDGHPDFVALLSQQHEAVVAYLGDGRGGFRPETIDTAPHPGWGSSGLSLVDLDGDGDQDALVTNGDMLDDFVVKPYHGIRWLENRGSFPWLAHEIAGLAGVERARAVDLDGDGDLDVVACTFVAPAPEGRDPGPVDRASLPSLVWLEQEAPGRFARHTLERGGRHVSLDVADVDGDGDVDVVVGNFQGGGDVAVEVWENRGRAGRR